MKQRIREIAETYCSDYPGINDCDDFERLWAIEQALKDQKLVIWKHWKIINILSERIGLRPNELSEIWEKEIHGGK